MAISSEKRKSLPKSEFGVPSKAKGEQKGEPGNYPIDTPKRARNALARVSQHGTPAEKASVRSRVAKKYPDIEVTKKPAKKK
jgi:hypothetical protein